MKTYSVLQERLTVQREKKQKEIEEMKRKYNIKKNTIPTKSENTDIIKTEDSDDSPQNLGNLTGKIKNSCRKKSASMMTRLGSKSDEVSKLFSEE
eukprot:CAMPEP_0176354432 /NCGR_PEP_ID=MMETSP0126-20121128/12555_1 /TAXON_ID=141414 ORGANISM="Strombidinopsis acuminatum, Strain SPMC142" /NCGR_SAMPLE_ID=MMETSP0126 /ASSEMBLY_ACC=CAM_ASM_000229 /LENGTH=94 /DNA_ID=CAMNT_0017706609 /DNA_START=598 /DNA_END=885 /DNA_ORIENTATION=+